MRRYNTKPNPSEEAHLVDTLVEFVGFQRLNKLIADAARRQARLIPKLIQEDRRAGHSFSEQTLTRERLREEAFEQVANIYDELNDSEFNLIEFRKAKV